MLRDGDPSHELTPRANTVAKRNRDRMPPLVCGMGAAVMIPPIGGYTLGRPVGHLRQVGHSQIRPKRRGKFQAAGGAVS